MLNNVMLRALVEAGVDRDDLEPMLAVGIAPGVVLRLILKYGPVAIEVLHAFFGRRDGGAIPWTFADGTYEAGLVNQQVHAALTDSGLPSQAIDRVLRTGRTLKEIVEAAMKLGSVAAQVLADLEQFTVAYS
jgi:hypothetical protein